MPLPDLTEAERAELVALLRAEIKNTRWPRAPRTRALRAILEKLEPPAVRPEPFPAPKPIGEPSMVPSEAARGLSQTFRQLVDRDPEGNKEPESRYYQRRPEQEFIYHLDPFLRGTAVVRPAGPVQPLGPRAGSNTRRTKLTCLSPPEQAMGDLFDAAP